MKKFKLIIFSFVCFVTFWNITTFGFDYEIENYDVNVNVNENNTFDVVEKITVNFIKPKHGIYRKIPLTSSFIRTDNTIFSNAVQIENISVNEKFSKSKEEGYQIIKIGDKNETLTGVHEYELKYTYEVWKDLSNELDEMYYPIIGDEWEDTIIKNASFTITMPKDFDESLLKFLSNHESNLYKANVDYILDGNTITGKMNRVLIPKESLSVNILLPQGYFSKNKLEEDNSYPIYVMIFSVICVLIADMMWSKHGKDDKVEKLIEYYPPMQYNSLEVGALESGMPDNRNVLSLVIYLANKGYLKIVENKDDIWPLKYKKDFAIKKLKNYTENNKNEKDFFNALFNNRNKVFFSELSNYSDKEFYKAICEIENNMDKAIKEKKVFDKIPVVKMILLAIMVLLIFILTNVRPIMMVRGIDAAAYTAIVPGYIYLVGPTIMSFMSNLYIVMFAVGNICLIVVILFIFIMPRRTEYGNHIFAKIKGFKEFIKKANKEELESLIKKDPNYFYDILPYAYSLGISETYIKKFKDLNIEEPSWYYPLEEFDFGDFTKFINTSMVLLVVSTSPGGSGHGMGSSGGGGAW